MEQQENIIKAVAEESRHFFEQPHALRSIAILIVALIITYYLSKLVAMAIVKIAQFIAVRSDNAPDAEKKIKLRRVETYLSVTIAVMRAIIVGLVGFLVWPQISPSADNSAAAIGASAFFIVLAGGTIGMILRDITAGAAMIIEKWFDVGDYIRVEPFLDVNGVVERITLRSTKLRSLNGEVIWMHNQHMQAVKVTPHGLRTMAVDVFVNNKRVGEMIIKKAIETVPIGTIKVTVKPEIVKEEKWGDHLWLFTVVASTPPGREWLIEKYFVDSLQDLDAKRQGPDTLVRRPIARFADERAEQSFKRAVRMSKANKS